VHFVGFYYKNVNKLF